MQFYNATKKLIPCICSLKKNPNRRVKPKTAAQSSTPNLRINKNRAHIIKYAVGILLRGSQPNPGKPKENLRLELHCNYEILDMSMYLQHVKLPLRFILCSPKSDGQKSCLARKTWDECLWYGNTSSTRNTM